MYHSLFQKAQRSQAGNAPRSTGLCPRLYAGPPTSNNVQSLCDELMALFADADAAVWCSSIHRSKGLEAERVFQVRSDALRLAYGSMLAWQAEQEANLEYVAHTRAKRALYRIPTEKQPAE